MSHKATNWAVLQRGIRPAAKLVLWHLADRHHPDNGCFPSQARLAEDCEISPSSLNDQLKALESAGLIRREQRIDPDTKRQKSTRYILGFEDDFDQGVAEPAPEIGDGPTPEIGDGADSENRADPTPKNPGSRHRKSESKPVKEPGKEPGPITSRQADRFWEAYPEEGRANTAKSGLIFLMMNRVAELGSADRLIAAAVAYATAIDKAGTKPLALHNWLKNKDLVHQYAPDGDGPADPTNPDGLSERQWESWVGAYERNGNWDSKLGPRPGETGCRAPEEIQRKHGFEPKKGAPA